MGIHSRSFGRLGESVKEGTTQGRRSEAGTLEAQDKGAFTLSTLNQHLDPHPSARHTHTLSLGTSAQEAVFELN